jgi:hypothetical protein
MKIASALTYSSQSCNNFSSNFISISKSAAILIILVNSHYISYTINCYVHIFTLTVYRNFTNISNNNINLCKTTRSMEFT